MNFQKYLAELLGTFSLTLMVSISILMSLPFPTPLIAGLTLGLFVYTIGHLSGAHLNPAVTIGLASVKKISPKDAVLYIVFQVVGALLAMVFGQWMMGAGTNLVIENTLSVGIAEALGAFVLAFGVSAAVHQKVDGAASGLVVGGSLTLGILMASSFSNGVLNPAVAIGIGSVSWVYLLAPVLGSVLACWVFKGLYHK